MRRYAKIVFESPLPQLDRHFDYKIPESLEPVIKIGQRVLVPFGRNSALRQGIIAELSDATDFAGAIADIDSIVWELPVLPSEHLEFLQAVADRQGSTLGDVLKQAIPDRAVRVEKHWKSYAEWKLGATTGERNLLLAAARHEGRNYGDVVVEASSWVHESIDLALEAISASQSSLICVPDYRDLSILKEVLSQLGLAGITVDYSTSQTKTDRYAAYLSVLTQEPVIVLGNHSAIYAPVSNLGSIVVYDESDESHQELSSPYANTRDVALLRNSVLGTPLHFIAVAPSTAMLRLAHLGYLSKQSSTFRPRIAFSSASSRLDDLAYRTIQSGLKLGPVLVQVSNIGLAKSAYCSNCSSRTLCKHCRAGGLWINDSNELICRVCSALNLDYQCPNCGNSKVRMGRAGSTRTAAEFGKSFPGVAVVEATGDKVIERVDAKPKIVVATPEAAPAAVGGFAAVVILDTDVALGRDSLFARERAIRQWTNSISMMRGTGQAAIIGVTPELGSKFATFNLEELMNDELIHRKNLGFPPALRILSVEGSSNSVASAVNELRAVEGVNLIGRATTDTGTRAIISFDYSKGAEVSKVAKRVSLTFASSPKVSTTGRGQRSLTIKLDDWQVL